MGVLMMKKWVAIMKKWSVMMKVAKKKKGRESIKNK